MNIKNDQINRLSAAVGLLGQLPLARSQQAIYLDALSALSELESARVKLNSRSAKFINDKRKSDPLYGRSNEYKQARLEKAKRIVEVYDKGD